MKLRKAVVGIRSIDDWAKRMKRNLHRAEAGQSIGGGELLCFENAAAIRKFFSDRRFELLRAIRSHQPRSIEDLAEHLGRDLKHVNSEVRYLVRLGIVELNAERGRGKKGRKAPRVICDEIELHIPI
jgi:predicted transcriptional regulator